jgi:hypothetical protein
MDGGGRAKQDARAEKHSSLGHQIKHTLFDVLDNCVLSCSNYIHPWINVSYFGKLTLFREY